MKSCILLIFASALCTLLVHCAYVDPVFARNEPLALSNPAADSIVGMWSSHKPETLFDSQVTISYLFKADGTGIIRAKNSRLVQ